MNFVSGWACGVMIFTHSLLTNRTPIRRQSDQDEKSYLKIFHIKCLQYKRIGSLMYSSYPIEKSDQRRIWQNVLFYLVT